MASGSASTSMGWQCLFCFDAIETVATESACNITTTPCGHMFHTTCLKQWFDTFTFPSTSVSAGNFYVRGTCPTCRSSFTFNRCVPTTPTPLVEPVVGIDSDIVKQQIEELNKMRADNATAMNKLMEERIANTKKRELNMVLEEKLSLARGRNQLDDVASSLEMLTAASELQDKMLEVQTAKKELEELKTFHRICHDQESATPSFETHDEVEMHVKLNCLLQKRKEEVNLELEEVSKMAAETRNDKASLEDDREAMTQTKSELERKIKALQQKLLEKRQAEVPVQPVNAEVLDPSSNEEAEDKVEPLQPVKVEMVDYVFPHSSDEETEEKVEPFLQRPFKRNKAEFPVQPLDYVFVESSDEETEEKVEPFLPVPVPPIQPVEVIVLSSDEETGDD